MSEAQTRRRRVGDTIQTLSATLKYKNESGTLTTRDLTGLTVNFKMVNTADGTTKVAATSATVDDAANGQVSYDFASADVDTAGIFAASFVVVDATETGHYPVGTRDLVILLDSDTQTAEEAHAAAVSA